jgi:hypothetical protein
MCPKLQLFLEFRAQPAAALRLQEGRHKYIFYPNLLYTVLEQTYRLIDLYTDL